MYVSHSFNVFKISEPPEGEEDDEGWVSWAWSYVPQILPSEEDLAEEDRSRSKPLYPVVSIGFYIHKASIMFKVNI